MKKRLEGPILKLDQNIDWEQLVAQSPEKQQTNQPQGEYMPKHIRKGDIIVAGKNVGGPGEEMVGALRDSGVACIIAASFSRTFYRNCINLGIPLVECPEAYNKISDDESIAIDFDSNKIISKRGTLAFRPQPDMVARILASGGLVPHIKRSLGK